MNFCQYCHQYLTIDEEKDSDTNEWCICLFCVHCQRKFECKSYLIEHRCYRQKSKDQFILMNQHLTSYKAKDITLPIKSIQCPKCKKVNMNKFERKYYKNNHQFELNYICINCHHNWS